jgi:hypothetical protein
VAADPDALADSIEAVAKRRLAETDDEVVLCADVVQELGMDPDDVDLPGGFRRVQQRGTLNLTDWDNETGLPKRVGL